MRHRENLPRDEQVIIEISLVVTILIYGKHLPKVPALTVDDQARVRLWHYPRRRKKKTDWPTVDIRLMVSPDIFKRLNHGRMWYAAWFLFAGLVLSVAGTPSTEAAASSALAPLLVGLVVYRPCSLP